MNTLSDSLVFYVQQHPQAWLILWGFLVFLLLLRYVPKYRPADQISREFRKAGVYPTEQQADALRADFAKIAAEGARKALDERLRHQAALERDKHQVARVAEISNAHVSVIREVGTTLQALELEYLKFHKSLASEQAKEALRLIVEQAVAQITEMADASPATLPRFAVEQKANDTKANDNKINAGKANEAKAERGPLNELKLNGFHGPTRNGDALHY